MRSGSELWQFFLGIYTGFEICDTWEMPHDFNTYESGLLLANSIGYAGMCEMMPADMCEL